MGVGLVLHGTLTKKLLNLNRKIIGACIDKKVRESSWPWPWPDVMYNGHVVKVTVKRDTMVEWVGVKGQMSKTACA